MKKIIFIIFSLFIFIPVVNAKNECKALSYNKFHIGEEVDCGGDRFYVVENQNGKAKLMTKYNIDEGYSIFFLDKHFTDEELREIRRSSYMNIYGYDYFFPLPETFSQIAGDLAIGIKKTNTCVQNNSSKAGDFYDFANIAKTDIGKILSIIEEEENIYKEHYDDEDYDYQTELEKLQNELLDTAKGIRNKLVAVGSYEGMTSFIDIEGLISFYSNPSDFETAREATEFLFTLFKVPFDKTSDNDPNGVFDIENFVIDGDRPVIRLGNNGVINYSNYYKTYDLNNDNFISSSINAYSDYLKNKNIPVKDVSILSLEEIDDIIYRVKGSRFNYEELYNNMKSNDMDLIGLVLNPNISEDSVLSDYMTLFDSLLNSDTEQSAALKSLLTKLRGQLAFSNMTNIKNDYSEYEFLYNTNYYLRTSNAYPNIVYIGKNGNINIVPALLPVGAGIRPVITLDSDAIDYSDFKVEKNPSTGIIEYTALILPIVLVGIYALYKFKSRTKFKEGF